MCVFLLQKSPALWEDLLGTRWRRKTNQVDIPMGLILCLRRNFEFPFVIRNSQCMPFRTATVFCRFHEEDTSGYRGDTTNTKPNPNPFCYPDQTQINP